jgi:hypothetical protein
MEEKFHSKDQQELVSDFIENIKDDPRINTAHISLYVSLVNQWYENGRESPLSIFSKEIMPICKISGAATYHRSIRQLHEYGYIKYVPSYNHLLGSLVYF